MVGRQRTSVIGIPLAFLIAGIAYAQVYEDRMEPSEIGIRDIDRMVVPSGRYVGNQVCASCHAAAYGKWLGTRHARSFVPMRSMMAMMMGKRAGVTACCPAKSGKCLPCHATGHNVSAAYRGAGFRMGEGVACEKCHGPGETYVEAMRNGDSSSMVDLKMPTEQDCMVCHKPKPSHAMICANCHGPREAHVEDMVRMRPDMFVSIKPPGRDDCGVCHKLNPAHAALMEGRHFDVEKAWKMIAHPRKGDK